MVNWTLSDPVTRVVIPVGIAYGSDVELAHKVMLEAVLSTLLILAEPPPSVLIVGFGENSLNFSIRIFVSELANRLLVAHDLYMRLEKALRENKIEISFPQRDIQRPLLVGSASWFASTVRFPWACGHSEIWIACLLRVVSRRSVST